MDHFDMFKHWIALNKMWFVSFVVIHSIPLNSEVLDVKKPAISEHWSWGLVNSAVSHLYLFTGSYCLYFVWGMIVIENDALWKLSLKMLRRSHTPEQTGRKANRGGSRRQPVGGAHLLVGEGVPPHKEEGSGKLDLPRKKKLVASGVFLECVWHNFYAIQI
jgi:hypothetical protein